jgi:hypothetical protein
MMLVRPEAALFAELLEERIQEVEKSLATPGAVGPVLRKPVEQAVSDYRRLLTRLREIQ